MIISIYFWLAFVSVSFADSEDTPVPDSPISHYYEVKSDNRCPVGSGESSAEKVFRGGRPGNKGLQYLQTRVKTVIDLEDDAAFKDESSDATRLGADYRVVSNSFGDGFGPPKTPNGKDDPDAIIAVIAEMRRPENSPLYVHCKHGRDRTGMALAFHRVFNECWSAKDAEKEWNQLEGLLGRIFHHPKHTYFHKVMNDPKLFKYFQDKIDEKMMSERIDGLQLRNDSPKLDLTALPASDSTVAKPDITTPEPVSAAQPVSIAVPGK